LQPTVRPIHTRVQGRVRYKIEGLQRSEALKDYLCAHIPVNDGIIHFSASTVTGNVLIRFDRHDHSLRGVSGLLAGLVGIRSSNNEYKKVTAASHFKWVTQPYYSPAFP
jgi:hypothetical protein